MSKYRRRKKPFRDFTQLPRSEQIRLLYRIRSFQDKDKARCFLVTKRLVPNNAAVDLIRATKPPKRANYSVTLLPLLITPGYRLPSKTPRQRLADLRLNALAKIGIRQQDAELIPNLWPIDASEYKGAREVWSLQRLFSTNKYTKRHYAPRYGSAVLRPLAAQLMFKAAAVEVYEVARIRKAGEVRIDFIARIIGLDRGVYFAKAPTPSAALAAGRKLYGQIAADLLTGGNVNQGTVK